MPLFERNLLTQQHQITSLEIRDLEFLSDLGLIRYRVVTPGQTDRILIANTCSQQYLPVQLSSVIIVIATTMFMVLSS